MATTLADLSPTDGSDAGPLSLLRFGRHARSGFMLPEHVYCHGLAVTADRRLLLACLEDGMVEYSEFGSRLSSWRPPEPRPDGSGFEDRVVGVAALGDGRVVASVHFAAYVAVLAVRPSRCRYAATTAVVGKAKATGRAKAKATAAAAAQQQPWLEELRVASFESPAWLLSVHDDRLLAVTDSRWHGTTWYDGYLGCGRGLALLCLACGCLLHRLRLDYDILSVVMTAEAVVTASMAPVKPDEVDRAGEAGCGGAGGVGVERPVVDGYSHSGSRLWRLNVSEPVHGMCSAPARHPVLYLALRDGNSVVAVIGTDDGRRQVTPEAVLNRDGHGLEAPTLLSVPAGSQPTGLLAVLSRSRVAVYAATQ